MAVDAVTDGRANTEADLVVNGSPNCDQAAAHIAAFMIRMMGVGSAESGIVPGVRWHDRI